MPELLGQLEQSLGPSYRLVRELGGWGLSRVFLAEEHALGRHPDLQPRVGEPKRRLAALAAETS